MSFYLGIRRLVLPPLSTLRTWINQLLPPEAQFSYLPNGFIHSYILLTHSTHIHSNLIGPDSVLWLIKTSMQMKSNLIIHYIVRKIFYK